MPLPKLLFVSVLAAALSTSACGLGPNPARATLQATNSPAPEPTATRRPPPTATRAASPTRTRAAPTAAIETQPPDAGGALTPAAGENRAEFVADVTIPDGTQFAPGAAFVKTWRLKNIGTNAWEPGYLFIFARGEAMGGPQTLALPARVAPGETVDISLELVAPERLGTHTGFWQLRTPAGVPFGIGPEANQPVYVQINVLLPANASPGPTTVAAHPLQVTGAVLSVDQPHRSAVCPQTFDFRLALTSQGAGTVSYRLEASTDTPGFELTLPTAAQSTFTGAGPRTFHAGYSLAFTGSVSGQVWVHVLAPNDLESNKVSFSLVCQAGGG